MTKPISLFHLHRLIVLTVIVEGYNSQRSSAGGTATAFILLVISLSFTTIFVSWPCSKTHILRDTGGQASELSNLP